LHLLQLLLHLLQLLLQLLLRLLRLLLLHPNSLPYIVLCD
jgi:hypothetical protein